MPLLDTKFQEIAAWLEAALPQSPLKSVKFGALGSALTMSVLNKIGAAHLAKPLGSAGVSDVFGLSTLVNSGKISSKEAEAYLTEKYPNLKWSGLKWGSHTQVSTGSASAAALSVPSSVTPGLPAVALSEEEQAEPDPLEPTQASGAESAIYIDPIPEDFDADAIHQSMESMATQLIAQIASLKLGNFQYQPSTIPGTALVPGSVTPDKFHPVAFSKATQQLAGQDNAITVEIAPSQSMDRWVQSATKRGPGRIWHVTSVSFPAGYKPTLGPTRYRIVKAGTRFGVMNARLTVTNDFAANPNPSFEVRYGIVIKGIPHFLQRRPQGIGPALSVGEQPVALASYLDSDNNVAAFNTANLLFHNRAKATYQDVVFPFASAMGSSAVWSPTATYWRECEGIAFSLIAGRSDEEVYQELNTLDCLGQKIAAENPGPHATVPWNRDVLPPAPPNVLNWNNLPLPGTVDYVAQTQATNLTTATRLVQGVPFRYEDCQSLVPTSQEFSLVVQPLFVKLSHGAGNLTGTWETPEQWDEFGLKLVASGGRDVAIDVFVW